MATVTRYPSTQLYRQLEYDQYGNLSETIWNNLQNITVYDQVYASTPLIAAASGVQSKPSQIVGKDFGFNLQPNARLNKLTVQYAAHVRNHSGGTTDVPVIPGINIEMTGSKYLDTYLKGYNPLLKPTIHDKVSLSDCLTVTTRCECGEGYENNIPHSWVNHCPACGRRGSLQLSWKSGYDNYHEQITCGGPPGDRCGADYCGVHGRSLDKAHKYQLTKCTGSESSTVKKATANAVPVQHLDPNDVPLNALVNRSLNFDPNEVDIDPSGINSDNFYVVFNPTRNTSAYTGFMYLDALALIIDYTNPTYSLSATITNNIIVGNLVTYTLTIKNTNKVDQGVGIPISINYPPGLEFVSSNGVYTDSTKKWTANLNYAGVATIQMTFKSVATGNQTIGAVIDNFGVSINKTSIIVPNTYTLSTSLNPSIMVKEGDDLSYSVTVSTNTAGIDTVNVNIPVPDGFDFVSSNGNYDPITGIWVADFINQTTTINITLTAINAGTSTQVITTDGAGITTTFTILGATLTNCNYVQTPLPADIVPYLIDGETYIISCNMEIVTNNVGTVHNGFNDFCISVLTTTNNIEDEVFQPDLFQQDMIQTNSVAVIENIGSGPLNLNTSERVSVSFVYDSTQTTMIRVYGAYMQDQPQDYAVQVSLWSISNTTDRYEPAGSLPDNSDLLVQEGNFANISLDPGESSENINLSGINLSGRESDPNLVIRGIEISVDYNVNDPITCNIILTSNGISSTKSGIFDPDSSTIILGDEDDKWDLNNIDLTDLTIGFNVINTTLDTVLIQVDNILFTLFSEEDQTGGNLGFTLNGVHSKNYDISLSDDTTKNEGAVPTVTTYDVAQSQGVIISEYDYGLKTIEINFTISGDGLEDAQERLTNATKYLSNTLNGVGLPLPNQIVFDWDPERTFNVVLSGEITVTLDTFTYTCKASFDIPDGVGFNNLKTTGAIDCNEGLINVRPVINVLATGGNVQIFDNVTGQSITIANNFIANTTLIIDCNSRTITDEDGIDYTEYLTLNSFWMVINSNYDYSNSTGCYIQSVQYQEGC